MYVELLDYTQTPRKVMAVVRVKDDEFIVDGAVPPGVQDELTAVRKRATKASTCLKLLPSVFSGTYLRAQLHVTPPPSQVLKVAGTLHPDWSVSKDQLTRTYQFQNRRQCAAFLVALMHDANLVNHHPDIETIPDGVKVIFTTHQAGNTVTPLDYAGAITADGIAAQVAQIPYANVLKGGPGSGRYPKGSGGESKVPPEPGTTPIPPGMIRGYHYTNGHGDKTDKETLDSVLKEGLSTKFARGSTYGEPNVIWMSTDKPGDQKHYVEVFVKPEDIGIGSVQFSLENDKGEWQRAETPEDKQKVLDEFNKGSHNFALQVDEVKPEQFATYHEPWHDTYRYIAKDPELQAKVVAGEFDWALDKPDMAPAIQHAKKDFAKKAELVDAFRASPKVDLVEVLKGGPGSGRYPKGSGVQSIAHDTATVDYTSTDGPEINRPASWGTTSHDMKLEPLPATMGEAENRIRSQPNEHAFVFRNGKAAMVLGNDDTHHVLAPEALDLKDAVLTHNHPSGYGLSNQDGVTAAVRNLLEMRAVTDKGTYSIHRTGATWPWDFKDEIEKVHNDVMYEMALRLRGEWSDHEGKITIQQANSMHHDEVYKRLQESIGGFTYRFEPKDAPHVDVAIEKKVEDPIVRVTVTKKTKIIRDIVRDERGLITQVIERTVEE